jgi:hypothetical protein
VALAAKLLSLANSTPVIATDTMPTKASLLLSRDMLRSLSL